MSRKLHSSWIELYGFPEECWTLKDRISNIKDDHSKALELLALHVELQKLSQNLEPITNPDNCYLVSINSCIDTPTTNDNHFIDRISTSARIEHVRIMEPISLSIVMDDILDFLLQLPNLKTIDILGENLMKFGLVTNGKSFSALKSIETLSIYGEVDESFIDVLPENLYELNVNDLPMSSIAIPLAKWIEKSHNLNRFTVSNMETLQDDSWSVVLLNSLQTRTNLISLSIPCDSTPTETSLNLTKNVIENNRHLQSLTISSDLDRIDSISSLTSSIVQLQSLHTLQLDISSLGLQDICDILERSKSLRNLLLDFNSDLAAEAEDLNTDAYLSRLISSLKLNSTLTKFDCTGEVFSFGEGELDAKKLPVVLTNNPLLHMTFEAFESRINLKAATSEIELINLDAARLLRISRLLLTFTTFLHPVTIIHILDYLLVRFPLDRKLLLSVLTNRKSIGCMSFGEVFNCQVLIRNCLSFQNKAR